MLGRVAVPDWEEKGISCGDTVEGISGTAVRSVWADVYGLRMPPSRVSHPSALSSSLSSRRKRAAAMRLMAISQTLHLHNDSQRNR